MFIIPMVGKSSRFAEAGFDKPKYKLKVNGQYVFSRAVCSFSHYFNTDPFLFVVRKDHYVDEFIAEEASRIGIKEFYIKEIDHDTLGQAETVYLGTNDVLYDTPLYIFNIDTFRIDFKKSTKENECDGYLEVFYGEGDHWSFVEPGPYNRVLRTTEKKRISNLCSDGLYYFKSKEIFDYAFLYAQEKKSLVKGEYYIAPLYNILIESGLDIRYEIIDKNNIVFCGTPQEYLALI